MPNSDLLNQIDDAFYAGPKATPTPKPSPTPKPNMAKSSILPMLKRLTGQQIAGSMPPEATARNPKNPPPVVKPSKTTVATKGGYKPQWPPSIS